MNWIKSIGRVGMRTTKNVINVLTGNTPKLLHSLGSMTLDLDDVILARHWLKDHSHWVDQEVVSKYEAGFARWNGSKYAFAFMSGRVALSACICALDLKPDDEVILPGYTCIVVPNAFHYVGVKTVYCDIELDTYGLQADQIEKKITGKTRAILLHHLYGLVCRDYEAILSLARTYGLKVIEDCAQATGAQYKGQKVGNFGDVSFYSTERSKVFNTIQGGIATTNDHQLADRIGKYYEMAEYPDEAWVDRQLYNVLLDYYQIKHPHRLWLSDLAVAWYGGKYLMGVTREEECSIRPAHYGRKMPAAIAAIGLNQLKKIDHYNELRLQTASHWDRWCEVNGYKKPLVIEGSVPVYLRYPVLVEPEKKQDTTWASIGMGIQLGVWYISNIHPTQRIVEGCTNANIAVQKCVNFPTSIVNIKKETD